MNQPSLKINSKSSPGQALTGEASKVVNTLAELATIVVLGLTALVEILDSRDRVERAGDVEVPVPNVVRTCLDNFDQLPFVFCMVCFLLYVFFTCITSMSFRLMSLLTTSDLVYAFSSISMVVFTVTAPFIW